MIKISANLSKKVPIPMRDFSSQNFGASLEVEVSDSDQPEALRERIRGLYRLLAEAVDEQVQAASAQAAPPAELTQATQSAAPSGNGNGNGSRSGVAQYPRRPVSATAAQQRAIHAISRRLNIELPTLLADYDVQEVGQLSVRDASRLIDSLKQRQTAK